ncbi:hypothetical protein VYU27_009265 [Nannochloropsis oceanica]
MPRYTPFSLLLLLLFLLVLPPHTPAFLLVSRTTVPRRPCTLLHSSPPDNDTPTPQDPPTPPSSSTPSLSPPPPANDTRETLTAREYFFGKEGEFDEDLAYLGISRQRLLLNTAVATALALGANFVGVTSALLNTFSTPEQMDGWKVDVLYPVRGFKRYVDSDDGYEFRYPQSWLSDQAVFLAETQARTASIAPLPSSPSSFSTSLSSPLPRRLPTSVPPSTPPSIARGKGVRPDAAFGPPGGNREENLSLVKSTVMPGFTLEGTLGAPAAAAELLLSTAIAPPGSGKVARLVDAREERRGQGVFDGKVYVFEYVVGREGGREGGGLHSLSVIAARPEENKLFTLTVLAPERRWTEREKELREVAQSFRLSR